MTEKDNARRIAPRKQGKRGRPSEIQAKRNRDQRRQQQELLDRYARRSDLPGPEEKGGYRP